MSEEHIRISVGKWESMFISLKKKDELALSQFEQEYKILFPRNEDKLIKFIEENNKKITLTVPDGEMSLEMWMDIKIRQYRKSSANKFIILVILVVLILIACILLNDRMHIT